MQRYNHHFTQTNLQSVDDGLGQGVRQELFGDLQLSQSVSVTLSILINQSTAEDEGEGGYEKTSSLNCHNHNRYQPSCMVPHWVAPVKVLCVETAVLSIDMTYHTQEE